MSDGPHRSLPMRRAWKRVAEFSDNAAFTSGEIAEAIVPALAEDVRREVEPVLLDEAYRLFRKHESSLFQDSLPEELNQLRDHSATGLAKSVLDHAIAVAEKGIVGREGFEKALRNALTERAARGARQVEEHYCRKATAGRANHVRERIERAISEANLESLSQGILGREGSSVRGRAKQTGLDDGVPIR